MVVMRVLITSFRFDYPDGVSTESAKVAEAFTALGAEVWRLAGSYGNRPTPIGCSAERDFDAPPLSIEAGGSLIESGLWSGGPEAECATLLRESVADAENCIETGFDQAKPDLVVCQNVFGLPLNSGFSLALESALSRRMTPSLLWHHDMRWQRPNFGTAALPGLGHHFPPRLERSIHVVINRLTQNQLANRGFDSRLVRNAFEFPAADDPEAAARSSRKVRAELEVDVDALVLLQPTRAIARKRVPDSIALAGRAGYLTDRPVVLVVSGPTEDGYESEMTAAVRNADPRTRIVLCNGEIEIDGLFDMADFVLFPSTWEGFGNPVIESVARRTPLLVRRYPVLREFERLGLRFFDFDDDKSAEAVAGVDRDRHHTENRLDSNLEIGRLHFSRDRLESDIKNLTEELLG